jgi:RNase H-like domain found in reverse transcriptase
VSIGCVIAQLQSGEERVIAYGSKKLSRREQNWPITKRETYACVYFVVKHRYYLLTPEKFVLRSDHSPIQWLRRAPELTGQNARWFQILSEFNFDFVYRKGW